MIELCISDGVETDLTDLKDFTVRALHLLNTGHEVVEARLGNDSVVSKNSHAVNGGVGLFRSWQLAANDLELTNL